MSHKSCDEMLDTADTDSKVDVFDTPITGADDGIVHTKDLYNRKIWFSRPRKNDPDAVKNSDAFAHGSFTQKTFGAWDFS